MRRLRWNGFSKKFLLGMRDLIDKQGRISLVDVMPYMGQGNRSVATPLHIWY